MSSVAYTLGIDLASQPETTGVCLLGWHADRVEVVLLARGVDGDRALSTDHLVELMLGDAAYPRPGKIGIDAPFGWPVAFVRAVTAPDDWPLGGKDVLDTLVKRRTDSFVRLQARKVPLSVSADRIAYPAMRAQQLLRRLREATGEPIDRTGQRGAVCEVYPDPGVTRLGLRSPEDRASYKGAAGADIRRRLVATLTADAPWLGLSGRQHADCIAYDDFLDALVAALLARAVQLGLTLGPPDEMAHEAASEGWIHLLRSPGLEQLAPDGT